MGCSNKPEDKTQNTKNIEPKLDTEVQLIKESSSNAKPNYGPLGEKYDFDKPFKQINKNTSNILFLRNNKIIFGDNEGIIHVYDDLTFENSFNFQIFSKYIQCMIELTDGNIAACSNDCTMKIFKIENNNIEILKECKSNCQIWSLAEIGKTSDFYIGEVEGNFFGLVKRESEYLYTRIFQLKDATVLNIFDLSENVKNIIMVVYMGDGAYFFDIKSQKVVGHISHRHFNPFKNVIQKISQSELLIGAENSIVLIDYKNFKILREFNNKETYSICKFSDEYLLTSYGEGELATYKMSRSENGQLELTFENKFKVIDGNVIGIKICPDKKLITFNMSGCIRIWNNKNIESNL